MKPETPKHRIKGRKDYQLLLKMSQDPTYYEHHRGCYLEAIQKAQEDFNRRGELKQQEILEKQKVAAETAKILLDRHRAKMARIVVER